MYVHEWHCRGGISKMYAREWHHRGGISKMYVREWHCRGGISKCTCVSGVTEGAYPNVLG